MKFTRTWSATCPNRNCGKLSSPENRKCTNCHSGVYADTDNAPHFGCGNCNMLSFPSCPSCGASIGGVAKVPLGLLAIVTVPFVIGFLSFLFGPK